MHLEFQRFVCTDQRSSAIRQPHAEAIFEATGGKEQPARSFDKRCQEDADTCWYMLTLKMLRWSEIHKQKQVGKTLHTAHVLQDILVRATVELDSEVHVPSISRELIWNGVLDATYHCLGECSGKTSFLEVVAILSCGDVVEQAGFAGLPASFSLLSVCFLKTLQLESMSH